MGLSWFEANASADYSNTNTNSSFNGTSNTTGTQNGTQNGTSTFAPNLSDYWKTAYGNLAGGVNGGGATPTQQTAIDFTNNQLANSPVRNAVGAGNTALGGINNNLAGAGDWWANQINNGSYTLGSLSDKAAAGVPGYSSYAAPAAVNADKITSQDTLAKLPQYSQFYDDNLIDPSLKSYDYGTDRAFSALDARTAGGGGFANERSGLGYSDLGTQSALGRGQLYSQLKNLGLTNAAGLATGDVNRILQADTTNAGNKLQADEFNANMLNNRQQFDVGAAYQGDQMRQNSVTGYQQNQLAQAGIDQNIINNVVTANGIDMSNAAALFQAGAITYGQLQTIVSAAQASNGGTSTNDQTSSLTTDQTTNTSGSGNSSTTKVGTSGSVGFK